MSDATTSRRRRLAFSGAAALSLAVAVVFATVGDGVDVPEATGARLIVIEVGHTGVWVLLATAFAIAAVRRRWSPLSNGIAVAAGILYAIFLVAVFVWR